MSDSAFLKIDGVPGDSKDSKHSGWIDVVSFNFGWTFTTDDGKKGVGGSGDTREGQSTQLDVFISKQGSAAHKLYLAYTGQLKIGDTAVLAATHDEHSADYEAHSERTFKMAGVKVVRCDDILPDQEWRCDNAGKNCGTVQPPAVYVWVTLEFTADNPTPPPKAGKGLPRGYGRYGGYRSY